MITDRFTAKVIGALVIVMTILIDVSCFIFSRPELRARATFPLVILAPSLPLFAYGIYLLRKANSLKDAGD